MKRALIIGAALLATAAGAAYAAQNKTAVFAGGCFWSMQHDMENIPGVVSIVSGYTGGHLDHPKYSDVTTETTGHYESVKVTYDPAKISYPQLLSRYMHVTDPTDGGGAFCDRGASYRPAIFVANPEERKAAQGALGQAKDELHKPIATAILPQKAFWPAEDYHQHFATKNPVRYSIYREGCGKDRVIKAVWGGR